MRIVLFDDILERHVRRSLARALRTRGHEVHETEIVWHGHRFPKAKTDIEHINEALDRALEFAPDLILNFRAASLTGDMLARVKHAGVRSAVWLPDDPVLYDVCYRQIVDHYDIVLHCGSQQVLEFYSERHTTTGVNFPFWTDGVEFPRSRGRYDTTQFDVVFLGNLKGGVRRNRYDLLASNPGSVRVYGKIEDDPHGISCGYLEDQSEIVRRLGAARLGLNIPQFFKDYSGAPYDFAGLSGLGFFQFPSRVIQYAAIGLPIISYGSGTPPATFPEMVVANNPETLRELCRSLLADPTRLDDLANATHQRFESTFSADRRAELLEFVVSKPDDVRRMTVGQRARLFAQFAWT